MYRNSVPGLGDRNVSNSFCHKPMVYESARNVPNGNIVPVYLSCSYLQFCIRLLAFVSRSRILYTFRPEDGIRFNGGIDAIASCDGIRPGGCHMCAVEVPG